MQEKPTALFWTKNNDGKVFCLLCPRGCVLAEGQSGFCSSRSNVNGKMVLNHYGRVSSIAVDPIEKKPLNHFLPGSKVLSFGTVGCNMACKHCQNWQISRDTGKNLAPEFIEPGAMAGLARRHACRSIAFTYNEPIIFAEYAIQTARQARELGIRTVAVSAGYINPEPRKEFFAHMDAANIDLKAFSEDFYSRVSGTKLSVVMDTIAYVKNETDTWLELTTLLIPGENDSKEEITAMCRWIMSELGPDVPLHFSAYHPAGGYMRPATPSGTLTRARQIALEAGLNYVYTGNTHDPEGESTYCPDCGKIVIERNWFEIGKVSLDKNACTHCGAELAGVFA